MTIPDKKFLYVFGGDKADGDSSMADVLGGKGANLAEMSSNGLPVPPGFTLPTHVCNAYYDQQQTFIKRLFAGHRAGETYRKTSGRLWLW